jgi:hypothetical protein
MPVCEVEGGAVSEKPTTPHPHAVPAEAKAAPTGQPVTELLTPGEIEALRQDASDASDYFQKAFSHLRPTEIKKPPGS